MPMTLINQALDAAEQQTASALAADSAPERTVKPEQAATLRRTLRTSQAELRKHTDTLKSLHARIVTTLAELEAARRRGNADAAKALDATLASHAASRTQTLAARDAAQQAVLQRQRELVDALGNAAAYRHLDARTPIALLPVRTETRWFARDAASYELRVRVFPDDVHIDQHQRDPQPAELALARDYWSARVAHGPRAAETLQAWETLCRQSSEARAMWLAARIDPFGRAGRFMPGDEAKKPAVPDVPAAPEAWHDMPSARALPDRWAVVGYSGGKRVLTSWSSAVAPELPMAPEQGAPGSESPTASAALAAPAGQVDEGMRWMTDFARAEALGMALRIAIPKIVARVLDRLLVFGVAASMPADESTAALEALVASHAATGSGFVPHGAPSNNGEMQKSAYRTREVNHVEAHARLLGHAVDAVPSSARALVARALGTSDAPFRHLWGADRTREREIAAMHTALWPTSFGGLLRQLAEVPVPQAAFDLAHAQFVRHVRAEGPLPTLRIDEQPYGVLPATSLARWKASVPSLPQTVLVNGLRSLHAYWERAQRDPERLLPRIDRGGLTRVLSIAPTALTLEGNHRELGTTPTQGAAFWPAYLDALMNGPADITASFGGMRIEERSSAATADSYALRGPLVSTQPARDQKLEANYIAALADLVAAGNRAAVQAHAADPSGTRAYLYMLLRSACLEALAAPPLPAGFVDALRELAGLPVQTLETLLVEIGDATGHRLDAWITSIASARLAELRAARPAGVHLGAYGWLDSLVPPGEGIKAGAAPVAPPNSAGFIHMPSLAQARTAALLHGGYLANRAPGQDDLFAIDLSADRVRAAKALLDGLAHGRTLNELLGHRLERKLNESGQAPLIPTLRALAPGHGGGVADGLALQQRWHANPNDPAIPAAARPAVADLDAALDALADLLLAEGVHQTANGNPVRAAAAFDALADGSAFAAEPEVVQTPTAHRTFTQRVALLLPAAPAAAWPGAAKRLRAAAEPRLEGWAASVLGAPSAIRFRATLTDAAGATTQRDFTLADFELCALDVVAFAGVPFVELLRQHLIRSGAADAAIDETGLAETFALAQGISRVIATSRALSDDDLLAEGAAAAAGDTEFDARAAALQSQLGALIDALAAKPTDPMAAWRASLVSGPLDRETPDLHGALLAELQRRRDRRMLAAEGAAARIAAVLGANFKLLPLVVPQLADAWSRVFAQQPELTGGQSDEPRRWLEDYARVRPPVEALDTLLTLQEAASASAPRLAVAHLPWQPGQAWVGRRTPDGIAPQSSLVVHAPFAEALAMRQGVAGLLVDGWAETVPEPKLMTGVAFHFDEPKAQAPQAVLLAVPPDPSRGWQFEDVEATLLETLAVAKTRGVGPEQIRDDDDLGTELATYLPALYVFGDERAALKAA